jgi:hypothetical protein
MPWLGLARGDRAVDPSPRRQMGGLPAMPAHHPPVGTGSGGAGGGGCPLGYDDEYVWVGDGADGEANRLPSMPERRARSLQRATRVARIANHAVYCWITNNRVVCGASCARQLRHRRGAHRAWWRRQGLQQVHGHRSICRGAAGGKLSAALSATGGDVAGREGGCDADWRRDPWPCPHVMRVC